MKKVRLKQVRFIQLYNQRGTTRQDTLKNRTGGEKNGRNNISRDVTGAIKVAAVTCWRLSTQGLISHLHD